MRAARDQEAHFRTRGPPLPPDFPADAVPVAVLSGGGIAAWAAVDWHVLPHVLSGRAGPFTAAEDRRVLSMNPDGPRSLHECALAASNSSPSEPVAFVNGDPLDCRISNLAAPQTTARASGACENGCLLALVSESSVRVVDLSLSGAEVLRANIRGAAAAVPDASGQAMWVLLSDRSVLRLGPEGCRRIAAGSVSVPLEGRGAPSDPWRVEVSTGRSDRPEVLGVSGGPSGFRFALRDGAVVGDSSGARWVPSVPEAPPPPDPDAPCVSDRPWWTLPAPPVRPRARFSDPKLAAAFQSAASDPLLEDAPIRPVRPQRQKPPESDRRSRKRPAVPRVPSGASVGLVESLPASDDARAIKAPIRDQYDGEWTGAGLNRHWRPRNRSRNLAFSVP